jgi:hypothetical protein
MEPDPPRFLLSGRGADAGLVREVERSPIRCAGLRPPVFAPPCDEPTLRCDSRPASLPLVIPGLIARTHDLPARHPPEPRPIAEPHADPFRPTGRIFLASGVADEPARGAAGGAGRHRARARRGGGAGKGDIAAGNHPAAYFDGRGARYAFRRGARRCRRRWRRSGGDRHRGGRRRHDRAQRAGRTLHDLRACAADRLRGRRRHLLDGRHQDPKPARARRRRSGCRTC